MVLQEKKQAFTLAEVMVVLLILTTLLAVFAPFITKRKKNNKNTEELWRWSTRNYMAGPMDIYYNPVDGNNPSLFIGMTPDSLNEIEDIYSPLGKIVIRGGFIDNDHLQRQLQIRHGRESYEDRGHFAGTILADNINLLLGSEFSNMVPMRSVTTYPAGNIAFGFEALNAIGDRGVGTNPALNNIAIGHTSLNNNTEGDNNVVIGALAGTKNVTGARNTIIGYNAGFKTFNSDNVLIGYRANSGMGEYNTFIGAKSGQQPNYSDTNGTFNHNTAIGYEALSSITTGEYNIALGAGALKNLKEGSYNMAIGYNACANLENESYKTCIGANSGPAANSPAKEELGLGADDISERTYIGANPNLSADGITWSSNGYGGDAILEIHNVGGENSALINNPNIKSNTTTVINGNLVVYGKTFLTIGNVLYPFYYENDIFGTKPTTQSCTGVQDNYAFSNTDDCSDLQKLSGFYSDRRLKNISSRFEYGLNEINKLKVYSYKYKNDPNKETRTGVIAQDLQKIFPNSVFKDDEGLLNIRWDEMFYASINALKELNNKIIALVKDATNLENKIKKLELENNELQTKINSLSKRVEALKE